MITCFGHKLPEDGHVKFRQHTGIVTNSCWFNNWCVQALYDLIALFIVLRNCCRSMSRGQTTMQT